MPNKKQSTPPPEEVEEEWLPDPEPVTIEPPATSPGYYVPRMWGGVREVFQCTTCETFRDTADQMMEHVLMHYPPEDQEELLNKLLAFEASRKDKEA